MFTRTWLALLPTLSFDASPSKNGGSSEKSGASNRVAREGKEDTRKLTIRVLNVMHRGVMPHLTRAVLVMDWVAGCVDFGKPTCSI